MSGEDAPVTSPAFMGVAAFMGRHRRTWEFRADTPTLIAGPNGSGKSTLVDALLRTVFGFQRKSKGDRELYEARRPWDGGPFRASVRLRLADGRVLDWSRDFETDAVEVRSDDGALLFDGIANPGSTGSADRAYWTLVRELFGFGDLAGYGRASWIGQGDLLNTEFDGRLLRLADVGHDRLRAALERIDRQHKELTREPVAEDGRRLNNDRPLEKAERALAAARSALAESHAALRARGPDNERAAAVDRLIDERASSIARLEEAQTRALETARLAAERADAGGRLDRLVEIRAELAAATHGVSAIEAECDLLGLPTGDPADLPARLAELRSAWNDEARVEAVARVAAADVEATRPTGRERVLFGLALLLSLALGVATASGLLALLPGGLATLAGGGLAAWAAVRTAERRGRHDAAERRLAEERSRLEEVTGRIGDLVNGIPDAGSLAPATLDARLERFERARAAEQRRGAARSRHNDIARRINALPEAKASPGRSLALLIGDAQRRLNDIETATRELAENAPAGGDAGFPASARALSAALAAERGDLEALRSERDDLLVRLDRSAGAAAAVARWDREVKELTARVADLDVAARAHRAAHALLRDGYREFREHDEARLVEAVAARLGQLSGPVEAFRAEDGLDLPTVELDGRRVPVDSPHLSHGQRHLVMLAIRFGAADFLAGGGPAVPIIVDEPFAHLDDRHAGEVWELLERVAADRQVIVTTQDVGRLERLGARPTIVLSAEPVPNGRPTVRPQGETDSKSSPYGSTPGQVNVFDYETPRYTGAGRGGATSGDPEGGES